MGPTRIDSLDHARAIVLQCLLKGARTASAQHDPRSSASRMPRRHGGIAPTMVAVAAYTLLLVALAIWIVATS
jgi:hypothetical protein